MNAMDYTSLEILDQNEEGTLYLLDNDMFTTTFFITDDGTEYCLTNWQGPYPEEIDEISTFDWVRLEDINIWHD